jgi:hypothetical protein
LERRLGKIISFVVLGLVLAGTVYGSYHAYSNTYDEVEVKYHRSMYRSLGVHKQGDLVRAKVVIDEGSVKVLEGRVVLIQMLDSDNRANMESGKGYVPLASVEIDADETDIGYLEVTAHRTDTYYLVYRNMDWWNVTLHIADGEALTAQLHIKVIGGSLFIAAIFVFGWAYGRLFEVDLRERLGLVRRPKGPGSRSAVEPESPS